MLMLTCERHWYTACLKKIQSAQTSQETIQSVSQISADPYDPIQALATTAQQCSACLRSNPIILHTTFQHQGIIYAFRLEANVHLVSKPLLPRLRSLIFGSLRWSNGSRLVRKETARRAGEGCTGGWHLPKQKFRRS